MKKGKSVRILAYSLAAVISVSSLSEGFISLGTARTVAKMSNVEAAVTSKTETADGFVIGVDSSNTKAIIYGYKGNEKEVTVPDTFEGLPVKTISSYAFHGNSTITSLRFGSNLEEIQSHAISNLESLESLTIPGNVTILDDNAICDNDNLKRLIFENGETTLKLEAEAFGGRSSYGAELASLEYLELGKHIVFGNENFLAKTGKLSEIVVDKDNPNYVVQYNILFNKEQTTLIRGFYEADFLGIPATVTRIATGALDMCSGVTWVSVEGPVPFGSSQFAVFGKTALLYYPEDMPEWNEVSYLEMAETMRIPITADMKRVKDTIINLSLPKLKVEDMTDLEEVAALYQEMNGFEKTWVEDLCDLTMLDKAREWVDGLTVKEMVSGLPDPADITLEDKEVIENAGEIFDTLTKTGQEALGSAMNYKLRLLRKRIHDMQQVSSITPEITSLEGQVGDVFSIMVDVQPTYAINKNFAYQSENDELVSSSALSDGSGFMAELKKPGETTIFAQAIDSDCTEEDEPIITAEMRIPVIIHLKAPEKLAIRQLYDASVEVSWGSVDGAISYEVYRTEDGAKTTYLGSTITCDKVDTNLSSDVDYSYQVVAVYTDTRYNSVKSEPVTCKIQTGTSEKVEGTGTSGAGVTLNWSAATGAAKYEIYRNTFATGTFSLVGESTKTTYTDATAEDGSIYYYKIVAVSAKGGKGGESSAVKVAVPLKSPDNVTAQKESAKSVILTWTEVMGATRYHVYRSTSENGTYNKLRSITGTSYIDTGISNNKVYYYKVQAQGADSTIVSKESSSVSICVPSKVKSLKAVRKGNKKAKLTWKKVSSATGYEIYRSTSQKKGFKKIKTIKKGNTVKYTDKKIKKNKYYYYKVRCYWKKGSVTIYGNYSSTVRIKKK